jgi:integrase
MSVNAAMDARPPSLTPHDPTPPTPKQAAALLTRAWEKDPDWGCLLWVAMTTGRRRGELCALRWYDVDFEAELLTIARAYVPERAPQDEVHLADRRRRERLALVAGPHAATALFPAAS